MESFPFVAKKRHRAPSAAAPENPLSRQTAIKLADEVNRYWAQLGYDAKARVVETRLLRSRTDTESFTVVSNLRNGVPMLRLARDAAEVPSRSGDSDRW